MLESLTAENEFEARELFRSQAMNFSGMTLYYERGDSFKKLLSLQGQFYQTYLYREKGEVLAMMSICAMPRWINNKIAYAVQVSDFRIKGNRASRLAWRQLFSLSIKQFSLDFPFLKFNIIYASVLATNLSAIRNFVSPKRKTEFHFSEIGQFEMINIFARFSSHQNSEKLKVRFANSDDQQPLLQFLKRQETQKELGFVFDHSDFCEWRFRENNWPGFLLEKFIVVADDSGIVACTLPWSPPKSIKTMVAAKVPYWLLQCLSILTVLGINVPKLNESINTLYLSHLNISKFKDTDAVLNIVLNFIYSKKIMKGYHILAFSNWWKTREKLKCLRYSFIQRVPISLQQVITNGVDTSKIQSTLNDVGFEMSII